MSSGPLRRTRRLAAPRPASVEPLERRALLASLSGDGVLSVTGTDSANVLYLDRVGGQITVLSASGTEEFPAAAVRRIDVNTGGGDDSVTLRPGFVTHAGTPLPVDIDGGAGTSDAVVVFGSAGGDRFHATPTSVAAGPLSGGGVAVTLANVERFTADAHAGDDTLFLADTGAFSQFRLLGGEGNDTFTVGDGVTRNAWRMPGDLGDVMSLDAGPGDDALTYNDQASRTEGNVWGAYSLSSYDLSRGPAVRFSHPRFERVTLNANADPNIIQVIIVPGAAPELWVNGGRENASGRPNPWTGRFEDLLEAPWLFNASNATLTMSGPDAGRYTFASDYQPVNFSGIERLDGPDLTRPEITGTTYRHAPTQEVEVRFSENVQRSLQASDLSIVNAATGAPVLTSLYFPPQTGPSLVAVWRPSQPMAPGTYRARIAGGDVHDANSNTLTADYAFEFVVPASRVVGTHVFYNNSAFDNADPAATAHDDGAIATDKLPLAAGGPAAANIASVTSYARGLNGVIVDIAGLPGPNPPRAPEFKFERSAGGDGSTWAPAPPPRQFGLRRGAGVDGSDRVTLVWDDYRPGSTSPNLAVADGWLRVTVLPGARTSLTEPHSFIFGNLVGETGSAPSPLRVAADDVAQVRRRLFSTAPIPSPFDFDRNGAVTAGDYVTVRSRFGRTLAPPAPQGPPPVSAATISAARPHRATSLLHPERRQSLL